MCVELTKDTTKGVSCRSARTDGLDYDEVLSHFIDIWPGTTQRKTMVDRVLVEGV